MRIHYIAEYPGENANFNRKGSPAGFAKMKYFEDVFISLGIDYEIYSTSQSVFPKKQKRRKEGNIRYRSSFATKNKYAFYFDRCKAIFQLVDYLMKIPKDDVVLVYHERFYLPWIAFVHKIKKWKLIYEVEEIYGDVSENEKLSKKERKYLEKADAYIFPTELLNQKINTKNKPYVIIHGTYNVEKKIANKHDDGRIHCVYAGTFDPRKGGVAAAAAAGAFLDEKYHVHILGFGGDNDKKNLLQKIDEVNALSKCKVTYDGLLSGEEYIKFIQSCDIGMSTQNPNAAFNATSFPSKVLSYMANGLRVVSIKIEALKTSAVNDLLYYYEKNTPEAIANAIKAIDITAPYDSREKIKELDNQFKKDFKQFMKELRGER